MRYPMLACALLIAAACATKQDRTTDSATGRTAADTDVAAKGSGLPAGYSAVTDDATAKLTSIRYATSGGDWEVTTGPAHIIWAAKDTARGAFTASATFAQLEAPHHPEAYGLIVGGRDLQSPSRAYTYFLVRGNGQYLIKSWQNGATKDVVPWTPSAAVPKADSSGRATYRLAVRVSTDSVRFLVNDAPVAALKAGTVATDGIVGVRINHNLHVRVTPPTIGR